MLFIPFIAICYNYRDLLSYLIDKGVIDSELLCNNCGELMSVSEDEKYFVCRKNQIHY